MFEQRFHVLLFHSFPHMWTLSTLKDCQAIHWVPHMGSSSPGLWWMTFRHCYSRKRSCQISFSSPANHFITLSLWNKGGSLLWCRPDDLDSRAGVLEFSNAKSARDLNSLVIFRDPLWEGGEESHGWDAGTVSPLLSIKHSGSNFIFSTFGI